MKKSVLIALVFLGLALGSTNAQSCCTIEKENCKPQTCCPITPACCTDDVADKKKVKGKKNTNTIAGTKMSSEIFLHV